MPIVFDEVVGSVEPERSAGADEQSGQQEQPQGNDLATVRSAIVRIEQRAERLRAD